MSGGMVVAVSNRSRKPERIAPCGAELATGRRRPLRGIVLYRKIERQLRETELRDWDLPLHLYDCEVEPDYGPGSAEYGWFIARTLESLTATFTHQKTGAKIIVTGIWVDDDGEIMQMGTQYGNLTL